MEINIGTDTIKISIYSYCLAISIFLINVPSLLFCRDINFSCTNTQQMVQESMRQIIVMGGNDV